MTEQLGGGAGTTATYGVSDEVWRVISVEGERASAHERPALSAAATVIACGVVAAALVLWAGILTPRLDGGMSSGGSGDARSRTSSLSFELHNSGLLDEEVDRFESTLPGLEVVRSLPERPLVGRHSMQSVELTLRATDCARLIPAARRAVEQRPADGAGVVVVVHRPWGQESTTVDPPSGLSDMALLACGVDPGDAGPTG